MKNVCIYAGSFDPFTFGHLHVVRTASVLFEHVVIVIGTNPEKERYFDKEQMRKAILETLKEEGLLETEVLCYDGYIADYANQLGISYFVRGLRSGQDYDYEKGITNFNLSRGIHTVYIDCENYENISSSTVREKLMKKESIDDLVPSKVKQFLLGKESCKKS